MPTIRVDMEVYEKLKKFAKGFDTPNTALRKALGLKTISKHSKRKRK